MSKKQQNLDIKFIYFLALIVFLTAVGLLIFFIVQSGFSKNKNNNNNEKIKNEEPAKTCEFKRIIDGICVENENEINPDLVAVMIENHSDARPQSGLSQARIVYEAPVEANFSRFMAIFLKDDEIKKAGPVRSARPYYLDWLLEYKLKNYISPMYTHVGGSNDALDKIITKKIPDNNEFYHGNYFWRSSDRYAPHNTYVSSELWQKAWNSFMPKYENTASTSVLDGWKFSEEKICEINCFNKITASFNPPVYEAVWKFNSSTSQYERYQLGYKHIDQDGTQITADTIIIQFVKTKTLDEIGRIEMETIGEGKAIIFRDGYKTEGQWKKTDLNKKTQWIDSSNNPISLKAGKIWIEVINQRGNVEFE